MKTSAQFHYILYLHTDQQAQGNHFVTRMGNSLYQSLENGNGKIKVDLYPISSSFFSLLVALCLLYHLFPFRLL